MNMLQKLLLYWNTVRYLKFSQTFYRLRKIFHVPCTLGNVPKPLPHEIICLQTVSELDFDPIFLARFSADELLEDRITLLHESEVFHWDAAWLFPNHTPLWNYNLHYHEYLFPLCKAYKDTGNKKYLLKLKQIIRAWIRQNPQQSGCVGWESYPTALRLTNWLSIYTQLEIELHKDEDFHASFVHSVWKQYDCLAHHLEKDLLGNHYLEDLKALVLCSLFFQDNEMLVAALGELHRQCEEQILPDGMHFELSPMYHKIILEDMIRLAVALRGAGRADDTIEAFLQPMLDAAWSMEEGLERIPLFNDCGNNVAKSLDALCAAVKTHFKLIPRYKDRFPDSGYYIFKRDDWKLIVDAGQPGPAYLPGHAHCDAMSFELFKNGKPVIVNCGTYAYQCRERALFRSTAAHNTVMVEGVEQSQCWGSFRMAKRSSVKITYSDENKISIELRCQDNQLIYREIVIEREGIMVTDFSNKTMLHSFLHFNVHGPADKQGNNRLFSECNLSVCKTAQIKEMKMPYSVEFGKVYDIPTTEMLGNLIRYKIEW